MKGLETIVRINNKLSEESLASAARSAAAKPGSNPGQIIGDKSSIDGGVGLGIKPGKEPIV